jgi:hypothetical protein
VIPEFRLSARLSLLPCVCRKQRSHSKSDRDARMTDPPRKLLLGRCNIILGDATCLGVGRAGRIDKVAVVSATIRDAEGWRGEGGSNKSCVMLLPPNQLSVSSAITRHTLYRGLRSLSSRRGGTYIPSLQQDIEYFYNRRHNNFL